MKVLKKEISHRHGSLQASIKVKMGNQKIETVMEAKP